MGRRICPAVGLAPRGTTAGYCIRAQHGTSGRATYGVLQDVPEGQGLRQLVHPAIVHLSKATGVRVRCKLIDLDDDLRP